MKLRAVLAGVTLAACVLCFFPGRVTGTVEEQRARLPPPAECSDPVEGVWMALKRDTAFEEWYEFTLNIRRAAPGSDELKGDIRSHFWRGGEADEKPPPCGAGGTRELVVKMPGKGALTKGTVAFGASSYEIEKTICGGDYGRYNPDSFSGVIDADRQEFQSVNNDGGRSVNDPHVFRRVKCFDPPRKPPEKGVTPPAFAPMKRGVSCGR